MKISKFPKIILDFKWGKTLYLISSKLSFVSILSQYQINPIDRLGRVPWCAGLPEAQIWEKQKNKAVRINWNFELAFSVILSLPTPMNNSFGTPVKIPLQIVLENYWNILKSIGKVVEKF